MLLNSPGAMSLLNRSNSAVQPLKMASTGNAATSVASGAAAFGNTMGLGGGSGAGLSDDADQAALGSNSVQFSQSLTGLRRQAAATRMKQDRMAL
jgi:hypothetical protein